MCWLSGSASTKVVWEKAERDEIVALAVKTDVDGRTGGQAGRQITHRGIDGRTDRPWDWCLLQWFPNIAKVLLTIIMEPSASMGHSTI